MRALSLNLDFDEEIGEPDEKLQQEVLDRLSKMKISTRNLIAVDGLTVVLEHFGIFSIPAVLVFDTDGKLKKKFDGDVSYERDIEPLVRQLLDN